MAEHFSEPEEVKQPQPQASAGAAFNPLDEPVNEKSYSRPNVTMKPEDMINPIPEPAFQPPPIQQDTEEPKAAPKPPPPPLNPAMNELPKKDKAMAAGYTADRIINGYEFLCVFTNDKLLKFSERKMKKRFMSGEVNPHLRIPYGYNGQTMSIPEFVQDFNSQSDGALTVSQDFKDEVKPILQRILEKKGAALSDEQMLMWIVAQDLLVKGTIVMNMMSTMKETITMFKEQTEVMKTQGPGYATTNPPPPPPPQYQQPAEEQYSPPPQQEEEITYTEHEEEYQEPSIPTVNEFVHQMTNPDGNPPVPPTNKRKAGRPTNEEREEKKRQKLLKKGNDAQ